MADLSLETLALYNSFRDSTEVLGYPTFKLIVCGDASVGKTRFCLELCGEKKLNSAVHKVICFTSIGPIQLNVIDVSTDVVDTSSYYRGAQCALILFDLTNQMSYRRVPMWHREIKNMCADIPIVICGNKTDIEPRVVRSEQIRSDLPCFEISCKNNICINSPILALLRMLFGVASLDMIGPSISMPDETALQQSNSSERRRLDELMRQSYSIHSAKADAGSKNVSLNRNRSDQDGLSKSIGLYISAESKKYRRDQSLRMSVTLPGSLSGQRLTIKGRQSFSLRSSALKKIAMRSSSVSTFDRARLIRIVRHTADVDSDDDDDDDEGLGEFLSHVRTHAFISNASLIDRAATLIHQEGTSTSPSASVTSIVNDDVSSSANSVGEISTSVDMRMRMLSVQLLAPIAEVTVGEDSDEETDGDNDPGEIFSQEASLMQVAPAPKSSLELALVSSVPQAARDDIEIVNSLDIINEEQSSLSGSDVELQQSTASVFGGEWRGAAVAIKFLHCHDESSKHSLFKALKDIASLRHPKLCALMALCLDLPHTEGSVAIMTEFMEQGSLFQVLHDPSSSSDVLHAGRPRTVVQRVRMLEDIAHGLNFLHQSGFVHGSLKSSNVLMDADGRVKLADYGLSAVIYSSPAARSVAWMAPEILMGAKADKQCDMYSFGVLIWEIMSGSVPWDGVSTDSIIELAGKLGKRLPIPDANGVYPEPLRVLTEGCFAAADMRPKSFSMLKTVQGIQTELSQQSAGPKPEPTAVSGSASKATGDSRMSVNTMALQWQFLRSKFVKGDDDELEWLMRAKEIGAYNYAHNKLEVAEDKYHKSLSDIDIAERSLLNLSGFIKAMNTKLSIASDLVDILAGSSCSQQEMARERVTTIQVESKSLMNSLDQQVLSGLSNVARHLISDFTEASDHHEAAKVASDLEKVTLPLELRTISQALAALKRESDIVLKQMELWAKREKETDEYVKVMESQEKQWFDREREANIVALQTMRSYLPIGIAGMTQAELHAAVFRAGGLFSLELITELKRNRCLHWIIFHSDDIAKSNFLAGEMKSCFDNIEAYDIIELRALAMCVPQKFELDKDGKKSEWRARLMARVRLLTSQQKQESVKGGWDVETGQRALCRLAPLKQEQERRSTYFHRTKAQCDEKLKQYDDKLSLLSKKQAELHAMNAVAADAKSEYDVILMESRDADIREAYGVEKLQKAKEIAKKQLANVLSKKKRLELEIARLLKAVSELPVSREQFIESVTQLKSYFSNRNIDWNNISEAVMIEGVFDKEPIINKSSAVAAKFASSEEEVAQRKRDLQAILESSKGTVVTEREAFSQKDDVAKKEVGKLGGRPIISQLNRILASSSNAGGVRLDSDKSLGPKSVPEVNTKEMKTTKSKLLEKLVEGGPDVSVPASGHGAIPRGGGASFLDQIRAKKEQQNLQSQVESSHVQLSKSAPTTSDCPRLPPSFLDQIKSKQSKNLVENVEGIMSKLSVPPPFLDQIKSRREE